MVRNDPRLWRAVAGVALCLGLSGIVTGLIVARRQSASDAHLTSDALQREELRDGWRTLGVAAVREAQQREDQQNAAETPAIAVAPVTPPPNVVIVNVPSSAAPAPPNVTNINLPNATAPGESVAPMDNQTQASGYPNQSIPPANYSPVQGYLPLPASYPVAPNGSTPQAGYAPNAYSAPSVVAPGVGNGTIPGSTPNPALPNNGLVGSTPSTGVPNGSTNAALPP